MLGTQATRLDAVLITHEHNDHLIGLDDLRPMMFMNKKPMAIYAEERVLDDIRVRFAYAFENQLYAGAPSFDLRAIRPGDTLRFGDIQVETRRIMHGRLPILAFVINEKIGYFTDTNHISDEVKEEMGDLEILILDMLREKPHHSHYDLEQSLEVAREIGAGATYFIHMSHLMGPTKKWEQNLPPDVYASYDGLSFEL